MASENNMYIISGCNGSGKTTASYTLLPELLNCSQFINSDEFAKSLSPFDPAAASVTASRYLVMKFNYLVNRKADFGVETTLATRTLLNMIKNAQAEGYKVTVLYLWLSDVKIAINRVRHRVDNGGHDIPEEVIRRRFSRGLEYFFKDYIPVCDRWMLADNSQTPFKMVAYGDRTSTNIKDTAKYELICNKVYQGILEDD